MTHSILCTFEYILFIFFLMCKDQYKINCVILIIKLGKTNVIIEFILDYTTSLMLLIVGARSYVIQNDIFKNDATNI